MSKIIKERYYIEFYALECEMSTRIKISKKEYLANLDKLTKLSLLSVREEWENCLKADVCVKEYEGCHITASTFTIGCSDTTLYKVTAKEGYTLE